MSSEPDSAKHSRVLACALCKQRRVKCSRTFPCTNCVRAGAECVQPIPSKRRRRFPERQLLDRLRQYEDLLRENNVAFTPLHSSTAAAAARASVSAAVCDGYDEVPSPRTANDKEAIDVWQAIKRVALDDTKDDESDAESTSSTSSTSSFADADDRVKEAILANDHLLFGSPDPNFQLRASHPDQVQIFRLWQIYLDNINPLLKVTHTPTLQPRIIDAVSDIGSVTPALEALLFSIYSVAAMTLTDDECRITFYTSRDLLLAGYQVACKQALLKCTPWRSNDRDCLTAFFLYLISIASQVDPRTLACMVSVAIRAAQRMGMHSESSHASSGCTALEVEMRRRLWWALVLFDHRICEIAGQEKSTTLTPTWDCHPPLNVNDFELQAEMRQPPTRHDNSMTEALFAVIRTEIADYVRHSASHISIISGRPSSDTAVSPSKRKGSDINTLETMIETKYLVHCSTEVPLHYVSIWTTRSFIAKSRLVEHYIAHASPTAAKLTDIKRSTANAYALTIIECDTSLRSSPLTRGFLWAVELWYSPVLAYLHILNGLAKRPDEENADRTWQLLCENYEALVNGPKHHRTRLMFALKFSRITLQVWEARAKHLKHQNFPPEQPPRIVLDSRESVMEMGPPSLRTKGDGPGVLPISSAPSLAQSTKSSAAMSGMFLTPIDFGNTHMFPGAPSSGYSNSPCFFPEMPGQESMDVGRNQPWNEENLKWI